jgi:hypothetical protein
MPVLALLVVSCRTTSTEPLPGQSVPHDLERDSDSALVARHPRLLRRDGALLSVRSGAGERTYRDRGACEGYDTCARHRVRAVLGERHVAIEVAHGEGADMLLLDSVTGNVVDIGWLPYPSPSGRLFFVGFAGDSDWSPLMGASVWRLAEAGSVAERLRVVDDALVRFTSFAGWRMDRCVEFRGARTRASEASSSRSATATGS